jgi:hypothetical protein
MVVFIIMSFVDTVRAMSGSSGDRDGTGSAPVFSA